MDQLGLALRIGVVFFVSLAASASGELGDDRPVPLEGSQLYLGVGTIDTRQLENLWTRPPVAFEAGRPYVLQLNGPITPQRRSSLVRAGVILGDYLPLNAYLVDLTNAAPQDIAALDFVRWVGTYRNEWKLDPTIGHRLVPFQTAERIELAGQGKLKLTVILFEGRDLQRAKKDLIAAGATVLGDYVSGGQGNVVVAMDADRLGRLAELPDVQYVEEAPEITLRNGTTRWIVQSNIVDVTPLYDNGIHGEGQIGGVLDGQPDQHHCSLDEGKILFYNPSDGDSSHGTHVSCTIVGDDTSSVNLRGMAYLGHMVCNTVPSFTESGIVQRLELHHSQGARAHTNSWGDDGTTSYNSLCRGFDRFLYENEDDLVCLAVTNTSTLRNPENAKNLLAVGASQDTPSQASHCTGGTGPTADGRRKPEIYAPGCSTISASPSPCGTASMTGTSMACPAVTGTGMLVRQYFTDEYYPFGEPNAMAEFTNPSGALVKATLLNSAVDMTGISGYPSSQEGWGRVLADDALFFPDDIRKLVVLEDLRNVDGLSTDQELEYDLAVEGSDEKLKVTLVWTDPPASASTGSGFAAINDLDLEVESSDGELFKGNVFSGGVSVPGGSKDDRNNVEQVHLDAPGPGIWTVRVRAAAVNEGTQGFALVATGQVIAELPPLRIELPEGAPRSLTPCESVSFAVEITPGLETVVPGSPALHYRYHGGNFQTVPLTAEGGELYTATLPPASCDDAPEFYLSAEGDAGTVVTQPPDAPATVYSAPVAITSFADNFEADRGWTAEQVDLTSGAWERGIPVGCDRGDPPGDYDGSGQCYLTGNDPVNCNSDVDGGPTRLISPALELSGNGDPQLTYARWFTNDDLDADRLEVHISNDDGATWVLIESVEHTDDWVEQTVRIQDFVTLTDQIRVRFSATDNPNNSITEAAIDAVTVFDPECLLAVCTPGDFDEDGDVDLDDYEVFADCMEGPGVLPSPTLPGVTPQQCLAAFDFDADADVDLEDAGGFTASYTGPGGL